MPRFGWFFYYTNNIVTVGRRDLEVYHSTLNPRSTGFEPHLGSRLCALKQHEIARCELQNLKGANITPEIHVAHMVLLASTCTLIYTGLTKRVDSVNIM